MKRLALVRTGPVPIANESLARALGDQLTDWELVTVDVKDVIRRSLPQATRLAAAAGAHYGPAVVAGRWTFRDALLRTPTSNRVVRDIVRRQLHAEPVDAVLQLQSLFDAGLPGVPHL
ncbi:MAG: hypothetical protein JOY78_13560, partial [Pseudonocardia sp.]|nr:hypothetical protein [Pseudonocardia sp.]